MEFVCELIINTENIINVSPWLLNQWCIEVPVFLVKPVAIKYLTTDSMAYLFFQKEDRYNPELIIVHPPKELTEEQVKKINKVWDVCIKDNKTNMQFFL